ncbi:TetR/AcrR family transcriptional regulator [Aeromicrobium sp.]|uniref:TetR/AcrR family transcriptional regulator n=1 Tax=Aeromicrobium sp. TaxID=1871063 RepID=UPI003D6BC5E7
MPPEPVARPRAQRIDARSNAQRIVEVARAAFLSGSSPSLEEIAAGAEVGIATLYRHFPNREALIRAAYHAVFEDVIVPQLAPENVLPAFRNAFVAISVQVIELLSAAPTSNLAELTRELVDEHIELFAVLLDGAQAQGDIRADLTLEDVPHILGMLVVGLASPSLDDDSRARYLTLMFDALTPGSNIGELPPLSR